MRDLTAPASAGISGCVKYLSTSAKSVGDEGGGDRWRLALIAATLGYYMMFAVWPGLFLCAGVSHSQGWFLDSYAILAANDAAVAGMNPYAVNSLDPMGRPHVYSRWWLELSSWGWTREDNFMLGGLFVVAFVTAAFCLLRPRSAREAGLYFMMAGSPAVLLGVERANNDLLIVAILATMVPLLANRREWVRWLALVPWVVATLLKFYPAAALVVLMVGASRREVVGRTLVAVVLLAWMWPYLRDDYARVSTIIPRPVGLQTLGAAQVFVAANLPKNSAAYCGLLAGAIAGVFFWIKRRGNVEPGESRWGSEEIAFWLGSVMLLGCFFSGISYAYRYVYTLLMVPWLWKRAQGAEPAPPMRRVAGLALGLLLAVVWFDGLVFAVLARLKDVRPLDELVALADFLALCWQPVVWVLMLVLLHLVAGHGSRIWGMIRHGGDKRIFG